MILELDFSWIIKRIGCLAALPIECWSVPLPPILLGSGVRGMSLLPATHQPPTNIHSGMLAIDAEYAMCQDVLGHNRQ